MAYRPLGEDASVRLSYDRDPVLRNTAIAAVQFERGIARISVGPLVGFLNSDSAAHLRGDLRRSQAPVARSRLCVLTLRRRHGDIHLQAAADPQALTEFSAGFYVPNAIVSGLISASASTNSTRREASSPTH